MNQGDLSNEQWQRLEPLLLPLKPRTGKPNRDHRQVVKGILWILRTGAPWRDLPECYGLEFRLNGASRTQAAQSCKTDK
jgi:transposase